MISLGIIIASLLSSIIFAVPKVLHAFGIWGKSTGPDNSEPRSTLTTSWIQGNICQLGRSAPRADHEMEFGATLKRPVSEKPRSEDESPAPKVTLSSKVIQENE